MSEITFRDFASALGDDQGKAAEHLATLLGIDGDAATRATEFFAAQMLASPEFIMKAMGMRNVVGSGDRVALVKLLGECFALDAATLETAADAVLKRYP